MAHLENRQVGPYLFTLFVPGQERDGRWPWSLNRTDAVDSQAAFGKPLMEGRAISKEAALRAVEAAFRKHAARVRKVAGRQPQDSPSGR